MAKFKKFKFYGNDYDKNSYVGFGWYIFADEVSASKTVYNCVPINEVKRLYGNEVDYCSKIIEASTTSLKKAKTMCESNPRD